MPADQHHNQDQALAAATEAPASGHPRRFRITAVDLDSKCRELRVEGELDLAVADQLRVHLDAAIAEDLEVIVCLEHCEFIDSSGLGAILLTHKLMAQKGLRLVICQPSEAVRRVLVVSGLDKDRFLYPTPEAALADRDGGPFSPFGREVAGQ